MNVLTGGLRVLVVLSLLLALTSSLYHPLTAQELSYTLLYRMFSDGSALVTLNVSNATGHIVVEIPVYESLDPDSIVVFDESGVVLPHTYNGSHIVVYSFNSSSLTLQYIAYVGNLTDVIVEATIKPQGPSTILLPRGSALLTFNGTPTISYVGDVISLRYGKSGTYTLSYIPLTLEVNETETPTTITITTTETLTTSITTTETITQQVIIPQTTTFYETLTSTSTLTTTATITLLEKTTETVREVETKTLTETRTITTTETLSLPRETYTTTSTVTVKKGLGLEGLLPALLAIVAVAVAAYLYGRRSTRSLGEVPVEISSLDDRDRFILQLLKENPMNISELSRASGYSKSTVWRRVKRLEKMGLVRLEAKGNTVYVSLTEEGGKTLKTPT